MKTYMIIYASMLSLLFTYKTSAQTIIPITMDTTNQSNMLACQLTGPELTVRLAQLKKEIFSNTEEKEETKHGYIFRFHDDNDFALKLTDFILAERICCPFFQFELSYSAYREGISLKISGPPGSAEMIDQFLSEED